LLGKHVVFGARLGIVERDQEVPDVDPLALPDMKLLDDAAVQMLDTLAVSFDLDDSIANDRPV